MLSSFYYKFRHCPPQEQSTQTCAVIITFCPLPYVDDFHGNHALHIFCNLVIRRCIFEGKRIKHIVLSSL